MCVDKKYVDLILPLPVKGSFTYFISKTIDLSIGQRVIVQFGKRKLYTALVIGIHNNPPESLKIKEVLAILDESPIVNDKQLKLWEWIAEYYMCNLGEVMHAALPSSFKLASESKLVMHPDFDGDLGEINSDERVIIEILLHKEGLTVQKIIQLIGHNDIFSTINEMIHKEIILINEELHDKYKVKIIRFLKLVEYSPDIRFTLKQQELLTQFKLLLKQFPRKRWTAVDLLKRVRVSRGVLNTLVKKGVLSIEVESISRLLNHDERTESLKELTSFQRRAINEIKQGLTNKNVCLLHGVTSSGKTELYIKLIKEQIEMSKQVLYLLPEIALTTQIIDRLRKHFGNKVGVTHSHLNNSERVEVWNAVKEPDSIKIQYPIMLGARSALFLPYDNLGLIIVDEEHDPSYKQHQPAPRYHARDTAIYLSKIHDAKVLLGSATPALESYYNAKKGKYVLVEMNKRYQEIELPDIDCIDIRKAHLKKQMNMQFSPNLIKEIKYTLSIGKQVIIFQNRRGYSRVLSCVSCGFTPSCKHCDVSLTYYKLKDHIKCHYCGYTREIVKVCPSCEGVDFDKKGFGTEQIQDNLEILLPDTVVRRLDYDTTRKKYAHQEIIRAFEKGSIDVLVGTQMVTKGLDFDNVAVVGILNADNILHYPDFRSYERGFQLMMQVAGRAGRKDKQGKVLLQTYDPDNEVVKLLITHDYKTFYKQQISERESFNYPPFSRLIRLVLKHKNTRNLDTCAEYLGVQMRKSFGSRVLGPEYPFISRIRNYYHKEILLKIEKESSFKEAKIILKNIFNNIRQKKDFRSVRIVIDIDPI